MSVKNDLVLLLAGAMVMAPTAASAANALETARLEAASKIVRANAGDLDVGQQHGPNVNDDSRNTFKDFRNFRNWSDFRNFKDWSDF